MPLINLGDSFELEKCEEIEYLKSTLEEYCTGDPP